MKNAIGEGETNSQQLISNQRVVRVWTKSASSNDYQHANLWILSYIFRFPPTALQPNTHYEKIIEAFGGKGYFAETPDELRAALKSAFEETRKAKKPVLINVMISPYADRKPQVHEIQMFGERESRL